MNYQPLFNKLADLGYLETEEEMHEILLIAKELIRNEVIEEMKIKPNSTKEVLRILLKHGSKNKLKFASEKEAKSFFNKAKKLLVALPEFLRPK